MDFSDKVKNHKISEKNMFEAAYKDVVQSAVDKNFGKNKRLPLFETRGGQLAEAINKVTDFYNLPRLTVTQNDAEDESSLDTTLGRIGLTRRKVSLKGQWWLRGEGPLVINTSNDVLITLLPRKFGGYSYTDPETGRVVKVNRKVVNEVLLGGLRSKDGATKKILEGYCFYKPFPNDVSMTTKDLIKYILTSFSKFDFVFLVGVSIIVSLMGLITPQVTQIVYDQIIPSGTINDIFPFGALMLGVTLASTAFSLFQSLWISRIGDKVQFATQGALWIRLLNLPLGFFKNYSSGDLASRTFTLNSVCESISSSLLPTVLTATFSVVYFWQIFNLAPELLLPSFIIIAVSLGLTLLRGYYSAKLEEKSNEVAPKLSGLVYQLFGGISKIKVAGAEVRTFSMWAKMYAMLSKIKFSPNMFLKLFTAINAAVSLGGTMFIYFIVYSKGLQPAQYIAFNAAYGMFYSSVMQIANVVTEIASLKPAIKLIEPILKEVPESNLDRTKVDRISGKIDINNLKFRYREDGPLIINDLNLSFKSGEYIGIVGSTGCGKSTLFRLLLGFEKPLSGGIYFDNQSLDKLDLHSVRKRIGIVLQNGKLFADSIFANITITNPMATMDDAWAAAEKAGCAEDIRKMPMGMHTMVSEDGGGISGGQKQRIMIARALISSPDLLMFDEATSALDNITQGIVVDTLAKMDITRIVIAHRLSTIKNCDRIIYLHKGQVAEQGTYEELMALNGRFAELARRQIA